MNELCSIIMPVHNPLYGFQDSIESILNQTYKNIELIIVNDNSSSKYTEIIESYKNNHKCIKVFNNKEQKGIIYSLNKGISLSSGSFLARMDSDDYSLPKRIETQISYMKKNPKISILGTQALICNEKMQPLLISKLPLSYNDIKFHIISKNPLIHPSVIFRKSHLNIFKNNYYSSSNKKVNIEDYALWLKCISKNLIIENHKEVLIHYRKVNNSLSHKEFLENKKIYMANIYKEMINLQKKYPIYLNLNSKIINSYHLIKKKNYLLKSKVTANYLFNKKINLIFSKDIIRLFLINKENNTYYDFLIYIFCCPLIIILIYFFKFKKNNQKLFLN